MIKWCVWHLFVSFLLHFFVCCILIHLKQNTAWLLTFHLFMPFWSSVPCWQLYEQNYYHEGKMVVFVTINAQTIDSALTCMSAVMLLMHMLCLSKIKMWLQKEINIKNRCKKWWMVGQLWYDAKKVRNIHPWVI